MWINLIQESKSFILSERDGHSILNDTYIIATSFNPGEKQDVGWHK